MEKDELDFVSPARREMVRQRLTAVRRYMANPTGPKLIVPVRSSEFATPTSTD